MSSYVPRIIALILLLGGTLISGTLPILLIRKLKRGSRQTADGSLTISRRKSIIISCLVCFGGGVLFATCFIHLLPEIRETMRKSNKTTIATVEKHTHEVPESELLICAGFFLVYFVEELLHAVINHVHNRQSSVAPELSSGHAHSPAVLTCPTRDTQTDANTFSTISKQPITHDYGSTTVIVKTEITTTDNSPKAIALSFNGLLLVVALSFHSVFEGLAIGIQKSSNNVWAMFIAVAVHKLVISFVVGLEVAKINSRVLVALTYMIVFSCMSPVGILVGLGTESALSDDNNVVVAYLTSLATGTLLYVTFFEVMLPEKNNDTPGLLQFFAIMLGFGLMSLLTIYVPS